MQVAPQIIYLRNDALHCDALIVERGGEAVAEKRLGGFKVAGLRDIALTGEGFRPFAGIDLDDLRYAAGVMVRAE